MGNDEEYTQIKINLAVAKALDEIKAEEPMLASRPEVVKYLIHLYRHGPLTNGAGNNSHLSTNNNVENKKHERNHKNANE